MIVDFSSALATAVVETACALPASERPASRQADVSGSGLDSHGLYALCWTDGAAPTLALVKALLIAYDEEPDPVFWPNPGGRGVGTKPRETVTQ